MLAERARRGVELAQPVQPAPAERAERPRPAPRRVRPNTATAHVTGRSVIVARDPDALTTLIADEMEVVHHPTHSVYDGRELRPPGARWSRRGRDAHVRGLGNALGLVLALCRH